MRWRACAVTANAPDRAAIERQLSEHLSHILAALEFEPGRRVPHDVAIAEIRKVINDQGRDPRSFALATAILEPGVTWMNAVDKQADKLRAEAPDQWPKALQEPLGRLSGALAKGSTIETLRAVTELPDLTGSRIRRPAADAYTKLRGLQNDVGLSAWRVLLEHVHGMRESPPDRVYRAAGPLLRSSEIAAQDMAPGPAAPSTTRHNLRDRHAPLPRPDHSHRPRR